MAIVIDRPRAPPVSRLISCMAVSRSSLGIPLVLSLLIADFGKDDALGTKLMSLQRVPFCCPDRMSCILRHRVL